jgi:hypothetical protein
MVTVWMAATMALSALMTFGAVGKANAQLVRTDDWAITEFVDESGQGREDIGKTAAEAVNRELQGLLREQAEDSEVRGNEQVAQTLQRFGYLPSRLTMQNIVRMGKELGVRYVVTGKVMNYRFEESEGLKRAQVILYLVKNDVASGLPVAGASVYGLSGYRTGSSDENSLVAEALSDGASRAIGELSGRTLPAATVLNTSGNDRVLINRGDRAGFKKGMSVVVVRGDELVARATVTEVLAGNAYISAKDVIKGIRPGDKASVIYDVPAPTGKFIEGSSAPQPTARRSGNNNASWVTLLIVLAILGFLFANGAGGSTSLANDLRAEAIVLPNDSPGVRISWSRDALLRGNNEGPFNWQVYRNDDQTTPVAVTQGPNSTVIDDFTGSGNNLGSNFYQSEDFGTTQGGECPGLPGSTALTLNPLTPGEPYSYSLEVVYRVSSLSIPSPGSTGGGGTTGGGGLTTGGGTTTGGTTGGGLTTGGGTTTGGTTGGGTTTGGTTTGGGTTGTGSSFCYFITPRQAVPGIATPLVRPELRSPAQGASVTTPIAFSASSVRGSVISIALEYVIQFSSDPLFPANRTITEAPFVDTTTPGGQAVTSPVIDATSYFPTSATLYWRVGVRNLADSPGPVPDSAGRRYVFSGVRSFTRSAGGSGTTGGGTTTGGPPPPPAP